MSPTVFVWKGYRFFFFSREETRAHVHIHCENGEAKFWLEPDLEIARNHGLAPIQIAELKRTLEERRHEILNAWYKHFPGGSNEH
ncbi:TPA: DUF4160 domain-containing protein [Candidatus Sumerlaeota bacterium]|jgi:hypothetical protein|nr:DUF4160 domain-containing protein [Candidatus Sumerlaeota bacterium]